MTSGVVKHIFGKKVIVDLNTKHGIRVSPGSNPQAAKVKECLLKANTREDRKKCFIATRINADRPLTKAERKARAKAARIARK